MFFSPCSIHNQRKVLSILIDLRRRSGSDIICRPENFEDNFKFIDAATLIDILYILQDKDLIYVEYADYPDNFNISTLTVTPKGLNYEPQVSYDLIHKWLDRILYFCAGSLIGYLLAFVKAAFISHL